MKKSVTVHLGSKLFNIEEDAFIKLSEYLKTLNEYFSDYDDKAEIIVDIENRLAELFSLNLKSSDPVITVKDVAVVVEKVGTVSDFEEVSESPKGKSQNKKKGDKESKTDSTEDKDLMKEGRVKGDKKPLMRNPNDMVIAGVCSGLAAYYNFDVTFIRFLFGAIAVLGVASGGVFTTLIVLIYLGLWYLMPEANSITDQIKMQGQPVNLDQIKSMIDDQMKKLPEKEVLEEEARTISYKVGESLRKTVPGAFDSGENIIKFLIRLAGSLISISAFLSIVAIITAYIMLIVNYNSEYIGVPLNEIFEINYMHWLLALSLVIVATPLLLLMMLGNSMFALQNKFKPFITSFLIVVWIISVTAGASLSVRVAPEVNEYMLRNEGKFTTVSHKENLASFSNIVINSEKMDDGYQRGFSLNIVEESGASSIDVRATDTMASDFEYEVVDGTLYITDSQERNSSVICFICPGDYVSIEISASQLESISVGGDMHVDLSVEGFDTVTMNATDDISLTFNAVVTRQPQFTFNIHNSANLHIGTSIKEQMTINLFDESAFYSSDPYYFEVENIGLNSLTLNAYDNSSAQLYLTQSATINAFGNSEVRYFKEVPKVVVQENLEGEADIIELSETQWFEGY